jgi:excisionase family DNA binding protein
MHSNTAHNDAGAPGPPRLDRDLLTPEQLAARLGVKPSWVTKAARQNRIPHVRIGRYRRFYWKDVERWLDSQRTDL